jgi:uncharacterized protein (TIGR03083 family)
MADKAALYRAAQDRVVEIVRGLDPDQIGASVPACPQWKVRDLVAHMSGTAADFANGNMADAPGAKWTQAQVDARADLDVDVILDEWRGSADGFAAMLGELPGGLSGIAVMDLVTHEHDLREATGVAGPRDAESVAFTLKGFVNALGRAVTEAGLPAVQVVATDGFERTAGEGEPGVTVRGEAYELMRSLSGRRTRDQVRALDWDGDPEPYLDVLSPFGPLPD